jgi:hypothetical protein
MRGDQCAATITRQMHLGHASSDDVERSDDSEESGVRTFGIRMMHL